MGTIAIILAMVPASSHAATIAVGAGGDLQAALNAARPGDTILLEPGVTYSGNFTLPVHGGTSYITLRTADSGAPLPGEGTRITPAHARYLAKLASPNNMPALSTRPGAAYWRVLLVEFAPTRNGVGDIISLGSGSPSQNTLSLVPHHLIFDRVYIRGDKLVGQKRGIGLNSGDTTIVNSHIEDIKAVAQDSQAICGANGPGPYRIENNYLEAAGNVFLLGGDDPRMLNLVPSDLLFRGNTLTRPVSWRNPIVPAPTGVTATGGTGGTLAAGNYGYRVVARRPAGTTTATSVRSAEVTATVGPGGQVTVRWTAVPDATEYRVYGRGPGNQTQYWRVTSPSFTDTGAAGTAGTPPTSGTVWQVKNLFELKNTRRAQIDYNLMENNWSQAQNGIAVLFTVRNQYGGCPWCVIEDVTFEYNVVRNIAGGVNILGIDPNHPSQQTKRIRIRHNEFSGLDRGVWGGNGYFLQLGDTPRDITVDHNTIISPNGGGVVTVSGPAVLGFVFTNNVARHNSYGIFGNGLGYGNTAIANYFPDGVIRRNVLAGGKASSYPVDNLFPTVADFAAHFVDYSGGDFALAPGTDWAGGGTDAADLGADMAQLRRGGGGAADPPVVLTQTLPSAIELEPYSAALEVSGGTPPHAWRLLDGQLPAGISLDPLTGLLAGTATAWGTFVLTVEVADAIGATASQPLLLQVARAIAPVQIVTPAVAAGVAGVPYGQALDATGGLGAYVWSLSGGTLAPGLTLSPAGAISGTPSAAGSWTFTLTAADAQEPQRSAARTYTLAVAPPPNQPPTIAVRTNAAGTVAVGAPVLLIATAADGDGVVTRVDFFVNGAPAGTRTAPPFEVSWTARDGGPHSVTAVATDDDGASTASGAATVSTTAEIVIYAAAVSRMAGDVQLVTDATAAGGRRLWNPNRSVARLNAAAAPATYAEFTFFAEAGRPYHFWMRGVAEKNSYSNDSFSVQFSGTVTADGQPAHRIGTTQALSAILEDGSGAGVAGWGWMDQGYGTVGAAIYFERTGAQTIRLQQREDGLSIDQIVISPVRYLSAAPGAVKHDTTIVGQ